MHAEIIAIGDELTSGQRLDTNTQWLSQQLADLGVRVLYHTTVGDDLEANIRVFRAAAERAQLVVCTGGLGPTADDLTRQALSETSGQPLQLHERSLRHIESMFARRNRVMPETNRVQAMFPAEATPISNPHGTAPGIDMTLSTPNNVCRVFALPGVPAEMREMWSDTVRDAILAHLGDARRFIVHHVIKCFGAGESQLEQMLPDMIRRGKEPTIGITASKATISLRIQARGESETACRDRIEAARSTILQALGHLVYAEGEVELHEAVVQLLSERDARLAVVEIGGGVISQWLAEARTGIFAGSQLFATRAAADAWRRRQPHSVQHGENHSADDTSEPVEPLATLAEAAAAEFGARFALAVEYRSPDDSDLALIGYAGPDGASQHESPTLGHPEIIDIRTAKSALNLLRKKLRQLDES